MIITQDDMTMYKKIESNKIYHTNYEYLANFNYNRLKIS